MLKSTAKSEIVINDLNSIRSHQILNGYGQLWLLWLWHICVKHSTVCLTFGPSFWLPSVYLPRCGDKMWQDVFECLVVTNCKTLYTSLYLNIHQQFESVWFLWCSIDFHFVLLVLFFDSTVFCRSGSRAKNSSIFHHPCVSYILNMIEDEIKALPCTLKIQGTEGNTVTGRRKAGPAAVPARAAALRSWKQHSLITCCTVISTWRFLGKMQDIETKNLFDVWLHLLSALTAFSAWAALLNPGGTGCH